MIHTTIVSTDVLEANLADWAIVDCRFDLQHDGWGREQYRAAHVPGAVYASLSDDLAGTRTAMSGRHPLPSIDALAAAFSRFGIDNTTQVVVYDQDTGLFAGRLWWSLRYLGHDAVALLDGGWAKWVREGRPTRSGDEARGGRTFVPHPRREMAVTVDDVVTRTEAADTLLVDARGPDRFEGQSEPIDRIAGHIPGAVNHFYRWNLAEDGTMLPPAQLRAKYAALLGPRAPDQAIVYCGSGVSACHNLLAMAHAGLHGTRLYVGSWSEWSKDPARGVETGPPRPASPQS
jgi:thiosulfate/3-mercaptopyruvate sulfurtransferase